MARSDISYMNWDELINGVPQLCEEVKNYRERLKQKLGSRVNKDVRYIMLGAMRDDYASALWIIAGLITITKQEVRIDEFAKIVDQEVNKEKIELTYTDYLRRSVITRIYFLLDYYLASLSQHTNGSCERQVYKNAKTVQKELGVPISNIDVFSAIGYTRNSFHNNGIHQDKSQNYTINDRQYNFQPGNTVALHWVDISTLIHASIRTAMHWGQKLPDHILIPEKH